jgi:hypothetical protein
VKNKLVNVHSGHWAKLIYARTPAKYHKLLPALGTEAAHTATLAAFAHLKQQARTRTLAGPISRSRLGTSSAGAAAAARRFYAGSARPLRRGAGSLRSARAGAADGASGEVAVLYEEAPRDGPERLKSIIMKKLPSTDPNA